MRSQEMHLQLQAFIEEAGGAPAVNEPSVEEGRRPKVTCDPPEETPDDIVADLSAALKRN